MTGGLPSYQQSRFPNEKPPTLFSPASPKVKATKPAKDVDSASMASTSTFSSTVGLIKSKIQDHKARKDAKPKKQPLQKDTDPRKFRQPADWESRARTAEAYMTMAMIK